MGHSPPTRADRWPGLELRHLAALLAVAEESSFHRAGKRLGYTQPAVSQQIARLERIVGTRLLERPGRLRPVRLTEAGEVISRYGRIVMAQLAAAHADVRALEKRGPSSLRIGVTATIGPLVLPRAMQILGAAASEPDVEVTESTSDLDLLPLLEQGEIDICFADLPLPPGPFEHAMIFCEPYVLVAETRSPLAELRAPPGFAEVAALPLLCARSCRNVEQVLAELRTVNGKVRIVCRSDVTGTLHGLASAGLGIALVPSSAADGINGRCAIVHLDDDFARYRVGLVWNAGIRQSPLAEALVAGLLADQERARVTAA